MNYPDTTQASSKPGTASHNNRRGIALSGLGPMSNVTMPQVEEYNLPPEESSRCASNNFVLSPRSDNPMAMNNAKLREKVAELTARNEALVQMCNTSRHISKTSTGIQ